MLARIMHLPHNPFRGNQVQGDVIRLTKGELLGEVLESSLSAPDVARDAQVAPVLPQCEPTDIDEAIVTKMGRDWPVRSVERSVHHSGAAQQPPTGA